MRIYLASIGPHVLTMTWNILLSYYDLTGSPVPFRKETWEILKIRKRGVENDQDKKETRCIKRKELS